MKPSGHNNYYGLVNGVVVHSTPKSGMTARTDGLWGVRINHLLDVHVTGLEVVR